MNKTLGLALIIGLLTVGAFSQNAATPKQPVAEKTTATAAAMTPIELAKATVAAHGGDKFKQMKSLFVRGTVDITGAFSQVMPATFMLVISGERYVFELNNPLQPLKQIFDGKQSYSSGYELPPVTSLGFPLLQRAGDPGYVISSFADPKKKGKGFRITAPDGFYTDFIVDEKTSKIKGYDSSYDVGGRIVTTSVEVDEFQTADGVLVPKKYSQRFDLGQMTAYANFKAKEVLVNSPISDDVFAMPK